MTHFDELLRKAFEAGENRGRDLCAREEGYHVDHIGTFEEWRATLSGLDTSADLGPIEVGDIVRILPSWGAPFEKYHDRLGRVYTIDSGVKRAYLNVHIGGGTLSICVPLRHLEKVQSA